MKRAWRRCSKALGNPVRFHIMQYLAENQMCITGEIVEFTTLAQSTVSQHLKVLREAGLIEGEIEGPATCYCISPDGIQFLKDADRANGCRTAAARNQAAP